MLLCFIVIIIVTDKSLAAVNTATLELRITQKAVAVQSQLVNLGFRTEFPWILGLRIRFG
jgi:hypothetical protein